MTALHRFIRGIRDSIPSGYVLGRTDSGTGNVHLIKIADLTQNAVNAVQTGGLSGANPTAVAKDTAINGVSKHFMRADAAPAVQKTSSSQFGLCKVDGTTITASGGVISAVGGGASDTPFYPAANIFKPLIGSFTLASHVVTGTASMNSVGRGIYLLDANAVGSEQLVGYYAVPATPYTLTMCHLTNGMPADFCLYGLCFLDTSISKNVMFGYGGNGNGNLVRYDYQKNSALGTYASDTATFGNYSTPMPAGIPIWTQVKDDGTNFTFNGSYDGEHFFKVQQISRTDYLSTINYVGFSFFMSQPLASGTDMGMLIFSFKQS